MPKIKVLLIDDEIPYINSVREALEASTQFEFVGSVPNSRALMAYLEKCESPDLVLADLRLPPPLQQGEVSPPDLSEAEGLRIIRDLHNKQRSIQIVGFSNHFRDTHLGPLARQTLEAGAIALIPKTSALISTDLDWSSWLIRELEIIVAGRWTPGPLSTVLCPIPEKYLKVLRLIAQGMNENYQIGNALNMSKDSVRVYRSEIKRMLGVGSDEEAVQYARDHDWL